MKGKFFVSFLIGLIIFSSAYMWVWSKIGGGFSEVQALEEEAGIEEVENIEEGNEIKQANIDEIFLSLSSVLFVHSLFNVNFYSANGIN